MFDARKRPAKSDLVVPLEAKHLAPIIAMVQGSPEGLATRKSYNQKKAKTNKVEAKEEEKKEANQQQGQPET